MTSKKLYTLSYPYASISYEESLKKLSSLIGMIEQGSIVLAPEYVVGGYDYEKLQSAYEFTCKEKKRIIKLSKDKILSLTIIEKLNGSFYNCAKIYKDGKEIYSRAKHKLFLFGGEDKYFDRGSQEDIKIVEIDGIKIAVLICFELRFIDLWHRVRGTDLILIPAYWGKERREHLQTLSKALAIANQCFVMIANSKDDDMAGASSITDPFGLRIEDDLQDILKGDFDKRVIKKMRRYMNVGIK